MIFTTPLIISLIQLHFAFAAPQPQSISQPTSIPLLRRNQPVRDGTWARMQVDILRTKYQPNSPQKRAISGMNELVNQNTDSSYYGSLAVGSPPTSFDVILDTGSSDMWIAGKGCKTCGNVPKYDPAQSSTFKNLSQPFHISYGSGAADGTLGSDVVQMAGFKVTGQTFAVCNAVSPGLLNSPVSGLLGLAYQSIASSRAVPLWESLVRSGAWTKPLFSFFLTRFIDARNPADAEPGGQFLMGDTNTTLYTGDIDYTNIPQGQESYWVIPMKTLSVQGNSIPLSGGVASYAAIDTGTTLVGGPPDAIASIFAQIPGSAPATGDYESYYTYPCATEVKVQISFGGKTWSLNPADFMLNQLSRDTCLGAFFELKMASSAPAWIVGDTFLKNVYSVFRYDPPSVGFAQLSSVAEDFAAVARPIPTPTIGANPALATGALISGGLPTRSPQEGPWMWAGLVALGSLTSAMWWS